MFTYLQCLIQWNKFQYFEASFLSVEHTEEDINQGFCRASECLRSEDVIPFENFFCTLREPFEGHEQVVHLSSIANRSGFCDNKRALQSVALFSHFDSFLFFQSLQTGGAELKTKYNCTVKVKVTYEWVHFKNG